MPNHIKRGAWLHGVAHRLENEEAASFLDDYADRMIERAKCGYPPHSNHLQKSTKAPAERAGQFI